MPDVVILRDFLNLLCKKIFCVITDSCKELLDIRAAVTHQHYDKKYKFPEIGSFELILEAAPRRCRWRRGIRSGHFMRYSEYVS